MSFSGFCRSNGQKSENKRRQKAAQISGSCQSEEKYMEHEGSGDTNYNWSSWNGPQKSGKWYWENWRSEKIKTIQTALLKLAKIQKNSLRDLRKLAVSDALMENC